MTIWSPAETTTTGIPTLVTINVVIEPDPYNNNLPKIVAPGFTTQTPVQNGNILCWEIQNFCPVDLWIAFDGFFFQPEVGVQVTLTIPNLFNNFASYGDRLPAAVNNVASSTTCLGGAVSDTAPLNSAWAYTITLINENGVVDTLDPIVVLSGDQQSGA